MSPPLLATKLYIPPVRPTLVSRPRLVARLNAGLAYPLTLISAPPGFGKTTLLSEWRASPAGGDFPLAWLSLDADDNDPIRFLTYVVAALTTFKAGLGEAAVAALQAPQSGLSKAVLATLVNDLNGLSEAFALVLDDYHVITAEPVHEVLVFLLDHLPASMRLVILTRADPPLPLARLRARHQLAEIRVADLRFTPDEVTALLNQVSGLNLPAEAIAALEARTEGWAAGLQLAALSMQGLDAQSRTDFIAAFGGSQHYVLDYLVDEVLNVQPKEVRSFLLQTSILERLCAPLCNAVVEADPLQPLDGQGMLEALERMNLFLIPLDGERRWYRYHHLFADVLNRRLEYQFPQRLAELHGRASRWFEQNGFIPEATQQALMAGDQERATQLVEQNGCQLMMQGEVTTLLNWIEAVASQSQTHPWLAILYGWALALTGHLDRVEPILQTSERLLSARKPNLEMKIMLGSMAAARAYLANRFGDTARAVALAQQALQYLPQRVPFARSLRSVTTSILGDASWINGDLDGAGRAYTEAARIGQAAGNIHVAVIANAHLAETLIDQGKLREAARSYAETLRMATGPNGQPTPLAERVYAGLSRVSYEQNDLEAAVQQAQHCLELSRRWGSVEFEAVGQVTLARVAQAHGYPQNAQRAMRAAKELVGAHDIPPAWSIWVKAALARLWLAQGNLEWASQFVEMSGITAEDEIPFLREPEYLILLRVLLARGEYDSALALSERWIQTAEAARRTGRVIELLVLQALVWRGKKDSAQALEVLARAISLAQPEGYVRVFLDEGEPLARLLFQARSHQNGAGYAAELLSAMGEASGFARPPRQLLIEPLTARELEVLKLIQAGHSNQEIAANLVVSIATVKRHISNVYTKLGAKSRTQAVSLGRELKLFE